MSRAMNDIETVMSYQFMIVNTLDWTVIYENYASLWNFKIARKKMQNASILSIS